MANVYLKKLGSSTTDSIVLASAADVFGDAFGQEELFIIPNGATFPTGIVVEQTIEKITLSGALSDYTFAKSGTTDVLVYKDGALVATIRPQTDDDVGGDGTALEFTSGSVMSTTLNLVSATEIRMGGVSGQVLTTTAEAFVAAPTTITLGLGVNEVALTAGVDTVVVAFGVDGVTAVAAVAEVVGVTAVAAVAEVLGVTAVAAVAEVLAVAAPTVPTSVATDGDSVTFEVSTMTFSDLIAGQSVTVADYTLTATGNVSAAEVAAAFNGSAPVNSSFTGSLASWTVTSVSGAEVSFTHSIVGNVTDLAATTAGVTAVAAVAEVVGVEAVAAVAEVVGVEAVAAVAEVVGVTEVPSHSTLEAMDTMTGFTIGTDKIDLLGLSGDAVGAPDIMGRAADVATSDDLAATLNASFNGYAANQAGLVIISAGTAAGTYLYVNDATVDFSTTADVFIKLIGLTGTVGDVNTDLNVSDYFAV